MSAQVQRFTLFDPQTVSETVPETVPETSLAPCLRRVRHRARLESDTGHGRNGRVGIQ